MTQRILVLLIEDNRLVRDGLNNLLDAQPDCKVVAAAEDASAGLARLKETQPHVVLVDAALGSGAHAHRADETTGGATESA